MYQKPLFKTRTEIRIVDLKYSYGYFACIINENLVWTDYFKSKFILHTYINTARWCLAKRISIKYLVTKQWTSSLDTCNDGQII